MSSDILARKYRPRCLDDLVGQESVVKTLKNALEKNKLHQAYLLVGQFGSGKTSVARLIAASENCLISPGVRPCGSCSLCKGIFDGTHTDVEEVDAAGKFSKVEEVRKLKSAAVYASTDGAKKRYYIIDECLPSEALITMADGPKVSIGDLVNSRSSQDNFILSKDMTNNRVIRQQIIRYIKIPNDKQMYEIQVKDENGALRTLRITGNHAMFLANKEKIKAEKLEIGQKIFLE